MKNKLAIFDLDGTLYDTRRVNWLAYQKALQAYGASIDYEYFSAECNGQHYKTFLPQILGGKEFIENVHTLKKQYYREFLSEAVENRNLFALIHSIRNNYYIALVTTASRENCEEILKYNGRFYDFDMIVSQEDVTEKKPAPEGFLKAMAYFAIDKENTLIFEDSEPGILAAAAAGADIIVVRGYG